MPLPAPRANYHAKQNVNGVLRRVYSDGTKYYDRSNGNAEITDWRRPGGAGFHMHLIDNWGWWNGAAKSLSDLTAETNGYTLAWSATGLTWTGDLTVQMEFEYDPPNIPSGVLFGWRNSSIQTRVWRPVGSNSPSWRYWAETVGAPSTPTLFALGANQADAQSSGLTSYAGINRSIWSYRGNSSEGRALWSNGPATVASGAFGAADAPVTLHFGRNPADGAAPQNLTLRSVTIWNRAMTEAEMRKANNPGQAYPLHYLTDSFGTNGGLLMATKALIEASGHNVLLSQDAVGSTTLTQQAARYLSRPEFWNSTLVMVDGALEATAAEAIAAIDSMLAVMPHRRFLYVQSNPINPLGDYRRDEWIIKNAAIRSHVGEPRFCETLDPYLSAGDGSAEDNAKIALGQWPFSKCSDGTHPDDPVFHAQMPYDKLVANKWLPA